MANDQWPSAHLPLPNCSCGCYGYCSCPCGPFGCCNGVQAPPTRRSRFDEFCTQAPPPPMTTLFRAQSCRRLGEEGENNLPEMLCCREQRLSPPAATTAACLCDAPPQMFLTPPIVLKDRSRHRSPTPHPLATCCFSSQSPCRPSVRFCDSSTTTSTCACCPDRVIYPSQSGSCCRPRQRRESSIVRVISRGSSPVACEQTTAILAASLPSKAACCSIACGCDLKLPSPPICLPKPRGNLKYSHLLPMDACRRQRQRSPSVGCFCPPRKQTTVDCCTETRRCSPVQRCYSVTHVECCPIPACEPPKCVQKVDNCSQTCCEPSACCKSMICFETSKAPPSSPEPYERVETTSTRVERITTRRRAASCAPQRSLRCNTTNTTANTSRCCDNVRDARYYLHLVERKENELWDRITECDMDLTAFEYMMCTDVAEYIRESIRKSRELIRCDFAKIRRLCDPDVPVCCHHDDLSNLWHEAQCKLSDVMCMMDKVDRLRCNCWKWPKK